MQPDQRVLLFVFSVAYVFITALNFFIAAVYHRLRRDSQPRSRAYTLASRASLTLGFIALLCILYGAYVEPYWPEVTHTQIKSAKIAKATGKVRIVHISDMHTDREPTLELKLPAIIAAEKPDLIVYTGDSLSRGEGLPIFRKLMMELTKIAPVYAVAGNWDVAADVSPQLYSGTDVKYLQGINVRQDVRGTPIWLAGSAQWREDQVWPSTRGIPASDFSVFLFHNPDGIFDQAPQRFDLYCAGHTHGGQVALPFYGALTTNSSYDKQFERGLYRVKKTWLYVNRGIGMTAGPPRVRFLARPEITVIDLVPQT